MLARHGDVPVYQDSHLNYQSALTTNMYDSRNKLKES